uniref:Uncharacterized protein n=1 Tax=Arundo donax TaxID=35708 RepID=A0A0A9ALS0_ARUDO
MCLITEVDKEENLSTLSHFKLFILGEGLFEKGLLIMAWWNTYTISELFEVKSK